MNIAREEKRSKNCTWGAPMRLGFEEKTKDVKKYPVRLEENHEGMVWESQGKMFPKGGSDELKQMLLISQVNLLLKMSAGFSNDLDKSNFCVMVELKKPDWSKFKREWKKQH